MKGAAGEVKVVGWSLGTLASALRLVVMGCAYLDKLQVANAGI